MLWHLLALIVACIWGSTFVASKVLLNAGLTPAEIMCLRFALAWVLMLPFLLRGRSRQRSFTLREQVGEEMLFLLLGLTGGSLYFLAENTAVKLTTATSTVALIVGTTPIVTALMNRAVHRNEHLSNRFLAGSMIAVIGVALVVFNGVFVLDDDPLVMLLSLAAAVSWGVYSLIIRDVERRHNSITITRKVFFWGIVTMLPVCIWEMRHGESQLCALGPALGTPVRGWSLLLDPTVLVTLFFLGLIASFGCFLLWNIVMRRIGTIVASNYLYFNPVTSLIAAYLVLHERITWLALLGCLLIIVGVYLCNYGPSKHKIAHR